MQILLTRSQRSESEHFVKIVARIKPKPWLT